MVEIRYRKVCGKIAGTARTRMHFSFNTSTMAVDDAYCNPSIENSISTNTKIHEILKIDEVV